MEIKEKKEVTEFKEITVAHKCDNCGKIVNQKEMPNEWHSFSSHHNDWGNDSIDSYEYYEVCSPECYVEKFIKVVDDELSGRRSAEVDEKDIEFARLLSDYFKSVGENI